ncbi:hypothetical protein DICA2_C13432 [Diutina catenulata]
MSDNGVPPARRGKRVRGRPETEHDTYYPPRSPTFRSPRSPNPNGSRPPRPRPGPKRPRVSSNYRPDQDEPEFTRPPPRTKLSALPRTPISSRESRPDAVSFDQVTTTRPPPRAPPRRPPPRGPPPKGTPRRGPPLKGQQRAAPRHPPSSRSPPYDSKDLFSRIRPKEEEPDLFANHRDSDESEEDLADRIWPQKSTPADLSSRIQPHALDLSQRIVPANNTVRPPRPKLPPIIEANYIPPPIADDYYEEDSSLVNRRALITSARFFLSKDPAVVQKHINLHYPNDKAKQVLELAYLFCLQHHQQDYFPQDLLTEFDGKIYAACLNNARVKVMLKTGVKSKLVKRPKSERKSPEPVAAPKNAPPVDEPMPDYDEDSALPDLFADQCAPMSHPVPASDSSVSKLLSKVDSTPTDKIGPPSGGRDADDANEPSALTVWNNIVNEAEKGRANEAKQIAKKTGKSPATDVDKENQPEKTKPQERTRKEPESRAAAKNKGGQNDLQSTPNHDATRVRNTSRESSSPLTDMPETPESSLDLIKYKDSSSLRQASQATSQPTQLSTQQSTTGGTTSEPSRSHLPASMLLSKSIQEWTPQKTQESIKQTPALTTEQLLKEATQGQGMGQEVPLSTGSVDDPMEGKKTSTKGSADSATSKDVVSPSTLTHSSPDPTIESHLERLEDFNNPDDANDTLASPPHKQTDMETDSLSREMVDEISIESYLSGMSELDMAVPPPPPHQLPGDESGAENATVELPVDRSDNLPTTTTGTDFPKSKEVFDNPADGNRNLVFQSETSGLAQEINSVPQTQGEQGDESNQRNQPMPSEQMEHAQGGSIREKPRQDQSVSIGHDANGTTTLIAPSYPVSQQITSQLPMDPSRSLSTPHQLTPPQSASLQLSRQSSSRSPPSSDLSALSSGSTQNSSLSGATATIHIKREQPQSIRGRTTSSLPTQRDLSPGSFTRNVRERSPLRRSHENTPSAEAVGNVWRNSPLAGSPIDLPSLQDKGNDRTFVVVDIPKVLLERLGLQRA